MSNHIVIWDSNNYNRVMRIQTHEDVITSISADNEFLITGSFD